MAEDTSKKKSHITRRRIKSFRDINRELRAKLSNINNSLLAAPIKERRSHSSNASLSPIKSTSLVKVAPKQVVATAKHSHLSQKVDTVTEQRKELTPRSPDKPKIPKKSRSPLSTTSTMPPQIDQEGSDLSLSSREIDKSFEYVEVRRPKIKKIYTEEQLRKMINKLYKQTKDIRAKDPEVEKLLEETRESIQAIEVAYNQGQACDATVATEGGKGGPKTLEKLFQSIHDESKARTKRLVDEFEKLKSVRQQHGRDLDAQIAQQVRTEVDTKKELSDMLNDATMKMIMAKSGKKKDPIPQRSFFVNMVRSAIGL